MPPPAIQTNTETVQQDDSEGENLQDSVDLGYSLVSGSNAFVGLQEVNGPRGIHDELAITNLYKIFGNEEFQDVSATYNDASQYVFSRRDAEALIAKLPSRTVIKTLVDFFFEEVNWHYVILERFYFDGLFSRWPSGEATDSIKYLKPSQLAMELRYFPSLLFQVISLSLQFLPPGWDALPRSSMGELATSQTYSDLGDKLLYLLGRPGFALTAIQADFLRASWLKNCGRGVESWHTVGNAIRFV